MSYSDNILTGNYKRPIIREAWFSGMWISPALAERVAGTDCQAGYWEPRLGGFLFMQSSVLFPRE